MCRIKFGPSRGGEAALRDYLLEDDGDWVGDLFIAEIRTWLQRRVDTKGAWQERRRGRRRALHHQVRGDDGQGQSAGVGRKSD
jgi:hypothetical protein